MTIGHILFALYLITILTNFKKANVFPTPNSFVDSRFHGTYSNELYDTFNELYFFSAQHSGKIVYEIGPQLAKYHRPWKVIEHS